MNKKVWSVILLCVTFISFLLMIGLSFETVEAIHSLRADEIDTSDEVLPGASVLGVVIASFAAWGGFLFFGFMISAAGFFSALVNTKIAPNPTVKRISDVFLHVFSVVLIFIFGTFVYILIS